MIRRLRSALLATTLFVGAAQPALALEVGDAAPDFRTKASLGGNEFDFALAEARKKGPVVVYFYPKAFTGG